MRHVHVLGPAFVAVVGLGLGCSAGRNPSDGSRSTSQPIVHGTPSTAAKDATVLLVFQDSFCTGALIAPNLLLTARHCLATLAYQSDADECGYPTASVDPKTINVFLGTYPDTSNPAAIGKKVFIEQAGGCGHDLGVVLLDRDIDGAKIARVNPTKVTLGEAASTSGYGEDGNGNVTPGRYDRAGLTITFIGPGTYNYETQQGQTIPFVLSDGEIVTGESTCFGDSGGPLFDAQGLVIGTTWRGVDDSCIDRPSSYSAVASHIPLILEAVQASGHTIDGLTPASPPAPDAGSPPPDTSSPASSDPDGADSDTDTDSPGTDAPDAPAQKPRPSTRGPSNGAGTTPASAGCAVAAPGGGSDGARALAGVLVAAAVFARRKRRG